MGEIAEMMLDGTLCEQCGVVMDDLIERGRPNLRPAPGYSRTCSHCQREEQRQKYKKQQKGKKK